MQAGAAAEVMLQTLAHWAARLLVGKAAAAQIRMPDKLGQLTQGQAAAVAGRLLAHRATAATEGAAWSFCAG